MAFSSAGATLRGDINTLLTEGTDADKFLIGEKVAPVYESPVQQGQYPKFQLALGELLNNDAGTRTPGASYGRVKRAYTSDTFDCLDRGLEEVVDDAYARNVSRFFDAEVAAAKQTLLQIKLGHEYRVAAMFQNTTNFGTAVNSNVAYTEALLTTINFPLDVLAAYDALAARGVIPNTIIMSNPVFNRLRRSTILQNYVRGNRPTDSNLLLRPEDLAAALNIENIYVGYSAINSKQKGQPFSGTPIWNNTYVWVGKTASGDFMNGGAARTIVWNQEGGIWVTESYREEQKRSNIVRVRQNTSEKAIDTNAGYLIATQYS